jgi:hypothetical protein
VSSLTVVAARVSPSGPIARLGAIFAFCALTVPTVLGCSAATPVLAEPRAPAVGELRLQGGGAAIVPIAGDDRALARAQAPGNGSDVPAKLAAGVAEAAMIHPGVAPVVRAQIGVTPQLEASLRYGGRDVGVGGRWFFFESRTEQGGATTLSAGLEGRLLLKDRPSDGMLPADTALGDLHGYGAALPIVLAWQSDAGLVSAYLAALAGVDFASGSVVGTLAGDGKFHRTFGAATVGLGVGFRRVRAIVELGLERDWVHADVAGQTLDLRLWSLTPAFALSIRL